MSLYYGDKYKLIDKSFNDTLYLTIDSDKRVEAMWTSQTTEFEFRSATKKSGSEIVDGEEVQIYQNGDSIGVLKTLNHGKVLGVTKTPTTLKINGYGNGPVAQSGFLLSYLQTSSKTWTPICENHNVVPGALYEVQVDAGYCHPLQKMTAVSTAPPPPPKCSAIKKCPTGQWCDSGTCKEIPSGCKNCAAKCQLCDYKTGSCYSPACAETDCSKLAKNCACNSNINLCQLCDPPCTAPASCVNGKCIDPKKKNCCSDPTLCNPITEKCAAVPGPGRECECVQQCKSNYSCPDGTICSKTGACVECADYSTCGDNANCCPEGLACKDKKCQACESDLDCAASGWECQKGVCMKKKAPIYENKYVLIAIGVAAALLVIYGIYTVISVERKKRLAPPQ